MPDDANPPPGPVLAAALKALHFGLVWCRKRALEGNAKPEEIAVMMDALHHVPEMLRDWNRHTIGEIRTHLDCFDGRRWNGPDLVAVFDAELTGEE